MTQQHTPTPWRLATELDGTHEGWHVYASDGFPVAVTPDECEDQAGFSVIRKEYKANARRIVACVNVLAECKTEDIEYCIEHKWTPFAGDVFASRVELQRQRDELLAALKECESSLKLCYEVCDWPADGSTHCDESLKLAQQAIAKAEQGK